MSHKLVGDCFDPRWQARSAPYDLAAPDHEFAKRALTGVVDYNPTMSESERLWSILQTADVATTDIVVRDVVSTVDNAQADTVPIQGRFL